jgi:TATA-box binding protein (TBP) (component of TFIID and TFIIIB)
MEIVSTPFQVFTFLSFIVLQPGSYEPELRSGVKYEMTDPKAVLRVYNTGSVTLFAPSVANIRSAMEAVYPLLLEFIKPKKVEQPRSVPSRRRGRLANR